MQPIQSVFWCVLWVLGWALAINGAMITSRFLTPDISNALLIFMRNLFGALLLGPLIFHHRQTIWKTAQPWRQAVNVALIVATMSCTYYAYRNLPLAFATSVGLTGPIMTTFLAVIFLSEAVNLKKWLIISLGYCGVLIALHPIQATFNFAVLVLLGANLLIGLAIINRKILLRTDSPETILAYGSVGGVVLSGIISLFYWHPLAPLDCLILCGVGGFGVLSHYCYLKALQLNNASFVSPLEYTRFVLAVPMGILVFGEWPHYNTLIGSAVIAVSAYLLSRLQSKAPS